MKGTDSLSLPKPDLVYGIAICASRSSDPNTITGLPINTNKIYFPLEKLPAIATNSEMTILQCGTSRVLLPLVLVERKAQNNGFFACLNQMYGGLAVMVHAHILATKLLKLSGVPIVFGFVNVGNVFELWAMKPIQVTTLMIALMTFRMVSGW
jgi:hypothetical protein